MKRVNCDLLLAVKSATFVVKFTQRGTRSIDAGGRSGEEGRGDNGETAAAFPGCSICSENNSFQDSILCMNRLWLVKEVQAQTNDRMGVLPSSASRTKALHVSLSAKGRQRYKSHKVNKQGQKRANELVAEKMCVWGCSWDVFLRIY